MSVTGLKGPLVKWASNYGVEHLNYAARREIKILPPFQLYGNSLISSAFLEVDRNAQDIMIKCDLNSFGIPSLATGDGNCLFNSVSIALTGMEKMATELRLRTALEMSLNARTYQAREDFNQLICHSPEFDESVLSCCKDGEYSSIWTIMALSAVIGLPIQTLYPAMNGPKDTTPQALSKLFSTDENRSREIVTVLWSRIGPWQRPTWTANHFVPVLKHEKHEPVLPKESVNEQTNSWKEYSTIHIKPVDSSTPALIRKRKEFSLSDESGNKLKVFKVDPTDIAENSASESRSADISELSPTDQTRVDQSNLNSTKTPNKTEISFANQPDSGNSENESTTNISVTDLQISESNEQCSATGNAMYNTVTKNETKQEELPTPSTVLPLRHGKWHSADEIYQLIQEEQNIHTDVPPGNKSNCYLLVDNTRNLSRIGSKKRCEFYDDCGVWESATGRTAKTIFVVDNDTLRHVEIKNQLYSTKRRQGGKIIWDPLTPQPVDEDIVILSRYYISHKSMPEFKKRVSYFVRKSDSSLGKVALYEYQGSQPTSAQAHGNSKRDEAFVRTNPKTFDKIQEKLESKQPREIFAELKKDDSTSCARDFDVIRSKKHNDKKKEKKTLTTKTNIAGEILEVISMVNTHPYVQTIIHNKDQVPAIICYTADQIADLKYFLLNSKEEPLGIDRTFNLGSFFVTTIVYKNQRITRKNSNEHPIFLGPILLHKEASYKTYKNFLEHISTELDSGIENLELRISEQMEFGSDDEKALTKAIEHVFPKSNRYLCTKHLKDNIKHYCQNKVGMPKTDRDRIMKQLFESDGLVDAETTIDFEMKSKELDDHSREMYPVFATYFDNHLKTRLHNFVFIPNRKRQSEKLWTNNNAESLNNILKLAMNWRPKSTQELIEKIYQVTALHFMDYRSALHDTGNYRLAPNERHYVVNDALWRCKNEEEKQTLFQAFLSDRKRKIKQKYITSKDGKLSVPDKAKGTAKKPKQGKRPVNERTRKR